MAMVAIEVDTPSVIRRSAKRTRELFGAQYALPAFSDASSQLVPTTSPTDPFESASRAGLTVLIRNEYEDVRELPPALAAKQAAASASAAARRKRPKTQADGEATADSQVTRLIEGIPAKTAISSNGAQSTALALRANNVAHGAITDGPTPQRSPVSSSLIRKQTVQQPKPEWHAPWKLMRVISGHLGWVRALAVEPGNQWFASGAGDRTIKIWDLASGSLRLTLTGHISTVRGLAVSPRHPYLFSCGEDKMVKCWDLETNKVIRHYHGHLSGVYTLSLHPTLDVLVTGGRDGVARVWDMRTRSNIHVLSGHKQAVTDIKCQETDPQVITSSLDAQVRMWDLAAGKTMGTLTHHKKGVRALAVHPIEWTFASGSTGSFKQW